MIRPKFKESIAIEYIDFNKHLLKTEYFWNTSTIVLCEQVKDLETRLEKEIARAEQAEKTIIQLQDEYQTACDLARSKDQLLELGQTRISQLKESLAQATAQQEEQNIRWEFYLIFLYSTRFPPQVLW